MTNEPREASWSAPVLWRFGRDRPPGCPRWRVPVVGQRNFCRPAGDRKARAGGRRSAPSLPRREAENGHRDGRAPRQCPSWWPCASTGQWQFGVDERGERTRPRVWLPAPSLVTSDGRKGVRRGRQTRQPGAAVLPIPRPGRARSPAKSQLVTVRQHRPMVVWGGRAGQWVFELPISQLSGSERISVAV